MYIYIYVCVYIIMWFCAHIVINSIKSLVSSPPHLIAFTIPWANEEVEIPWRLHGDYETHLERLLGQSFIWLFLKWTNFCMAERC